MLLHALSQAINKYEYRTFVMIMTDADRLLRKDRLLQILSGKPLFDVEHCLSNYNLSFPFFFIPPCDFILFSYSSDLCCVAITRFLIPKSNFQQKQKRVLRSTYATRVFFLNKKKYIYAQLRAYIVLIFVISYFKQDTS